MVGSQTSSPTHSLSILLIVVLSSISISTLSPNTFLAASSLGVERSVALLPVNAIPDFTVTSSSYALTIPPGSGTTVTLTLTSINGYAGQLSIDSLLDYGGLHVSYGPPGVHLALAAGGTNSTTIIISALSSATSGVRDITILALGYCLSHDVSISVTVPSLLTSSDFSIYARPSTLSLKAGGSNYSTIAVSSINGFSGTISFTWLGHVTGHTNATLSPWNLTLPSKGSGNAKLSVNTTEEACSGKFDLPLMATSGSNSHVTIIALIIAKADPSSPLLSRLFEFQSLALYGAIAYIGIGAALAGALLARQQHSKSESDTRVARP